ncbi:hypothetical protein EMIHUDRAFT_356545, partial [Emiliania huxleyi CCMP1516]|uniref:Uncharacterized protein n=2 Tax=Emiliania huxleyi TaxID=2903 RepID=A0A0D3ISU8_EMIH1
MRAVVHSPVETDPAAVHPPFANYAHATSVPPASVFLCTSGQLGIAPDGSVPASAEAQAAIAFQNIGAILAASGAGLQHVVRLNAYVSGREHLPGYMRARDEALRGLPKTASTLMVVSGFARPEFVVEIEALAAVSSSAAASAVASAASSAASAASSAASAASAASSDGGRGGSGDSASSRHVRSSRRSISATPAAASAVRSAAHGRRSLHTRPAPCRAQSRALHGERASAAAVAAYVEDLRGSGVKVLAGGDGPNEAREIARRSRDFFWYAPLLK